MSQKLLRKQTVLAELMLSYKDLKKLRNKTGLAAVRIPISGEDELRWIQDTLKKYKQADAYHIVWLALMNMQEESNQNPVEALYTAMVELDPQLSATVGFSHYKHR